MPLLMAAATPWARSTSTRPTTAMNTAFLARPRALALGSLGHQHEPRPDQGKEAQAHSGVGHAGQRRVEGRLHLLPLGLGRDGGDGRQRRAGGQEDGCDAPYHGQFHQEESPARVCSVRGGSGVGGGTWRLT